MSFLSSASVVSIWRGYEYYIQKRVLSFFKTNTDEYEGTVSGSGNTTYQVHINIAHPRKSTCTCPHAAGRQVICKHKVALYFTAFPQEADAYLAEVEANECEQEEYEREQERLWQERYDALKQYVMSLSKKKLQEQLLDALLALNMDDYDEEDAPDW